MGQDRGFTLMTFIVVLAVVAFLFRKAREKRSVPLTIKGLHVVKILRHAGGKPCFRVFKKLLLVNS